MSKKSWVAAPPPASQDAPWCLCLWVGGKLIAHHQGKRGGAPIHVRSEMDEVIYTVQVDRRAEGK